MKPNRVQKKTEWTAEDKARRAAIRERFKSKPSIEELVASGELSGEPIPLGDYLSILQAVAALKKAREEAGLSLSDVAERSGIDRAAISRIETGRHANPTISTLCRYAQALGMRWVWTLEKAEEETAEKK
jgi:ribosome-binding protein aMBF1 (putative translation factor)